MTKPQGLHLDSFDRRILEILQRDNRVPRRDIGEAVHLSAAAVHRRIAALEEAGVIVGNVAIVDPARAGRPVTAVVDVSVESEQLSLLDQIKKHFRQAPEVQQCFYVTGDADFSLIITAESMADYEAITPRLFFSQKNVKHFRTRVVMDNVKAGLSVPIRDVPE